MATFEAEGLDWEGAGYFGVPPAPSRLGATPEADPWGYFKAAFHRAREGDFALMPYLPDILAVTPDTPLAVCCAELIGDAGSNEVVDRVICLLKEDLPVDRALLCCTAVYNRARLGDIPVLLDTYVRYSNHPDADIIPVWMSDLIESEDGPISEPMYFEGIEGYVSMVRSAHDELLANLATPDTKIFRGMVFGVRRLAQYILDRVRAPFVRSNLRHRFEASTGIDCSSLYRRGEFRPLTAAAVVEEFLESPHSNKFRDAVRYFFSHPIDDR